MSAPKPVVFAVLLLAIYVMWNDVLLCLRIQAMPPGSYPPIPNPNSSTVHFSPSPPIGMKLLMGSALTHYIWTPISVEIVNSSNIAKMISANAVSYLGILSAWIGGVCFASDKGYKVRALGYVFISVRTLMDAMDGEVARLNNYRPEPDSQYSKGSSNFEFMFDGICDAIGFIGAYFGIMVYFIRLKQESGWKLLQGTTAFWLQHRV